MISNVFHVVERKYPQALTCRTNSELQVRLFLVTRPGGDTAKTC